MVAKAHRIGRPDSDVSRRKVQKLSDSRPYRPVYFVRTDGSAPGRDFLDRAPHKVRATMRAVIAAVAAAPPHRFAGGGYWEAMHGEMTGWFEVRVDGPQRQRHFRLFCLLDSDSPGHPEPLLVIVTGLSKLRGTKLTDSDYAAVRALGVEYRSSNPRSVM